MVSEREHTFFKTERIRESEYNMSRTDQSTHNGFSHISNEEEWPGIDSRYRLIVVAALRSKQLQRGSLPRIEIDRQRRKNTSIALEEVKRGLVPFTVTPEARKKISNGHEPTIGDE
jgi:DNA-directed RNA polymerase omega subunit